ncbi:MAG: hypothetical protein ACOXZ0_08410 [Eubacteriales bacterium]|jgi:hypothetical protein
MSKDFEKDLSKIFKSIEGKVEAVTGEVAITKVFTDQFMRQNTSFQSFEAFINAAYPNGFSETHLSGLQSGALDVFISQNSKFKSWGELYTAAGEKYILDNIKL